MGGIKSSRQREVNWLVYKHIFWFTPEECEFIWLGGKVGCGTQGPWMVLGRADSGRGTRQCQLGYLTWDPRKVWQVEKGVWMKRVREAH